LLAELLYENIDAPVTEGAFASPELIAYKAEVKETPEFLLQLGEAVDKAVKKYAALGSGSYNPVIRMESPETDGKRSVDIPSINTYGVRRMEAMKTEEDFINIMRGTECIPKVLSSIGYVRNNYAPESVLTQGFGDQGSVVNAAAVLLTKLGFTPEKKPLALTGQGKKALEGYYKFAPGDDFVPAGIAYTNDKGERKLFVVPFMADLSELAGYVYNPAESKAKFDGGSGTATVQVYVQYMAKPTDTAAIGGGGLWGGLTQATGGAETDEVPTELLMLEKELPLDMLSTDAIDIGFLPANSQNGTRYVAFMGTPEGEVYGKESISSGSKVTGIKTVVKGIADREDLVNWNTVPEGVPLEYFFLTAGINLPDLPQRAAQPLYDAIAEVQPQTENPDNYSYFKWFHRGSLYRFIEGQTALEDDMAAFGGLVVGRLETPRCIVLTTYLAKDGKLRTSIDLAQAINEIHNPDSVSEETRSGFNILSGLAMSTLEKDCLLGETKVGYLDLWALVPKNAEGALELETIPNDREYRDAALEVLQEWNFPEALLNSVKDTDKVIVTPTKPAVYNGEERWAWLEIDPKTNYTIAVFDNGQHSSMAEMTQLEFEACLEGVGVGIYVGVLTFAACILVQPLIGFEKASDAVERAHIMASTIGAMISLFTGDPLSAGLGVGQTIGEQATGNTNPWIGLSGFAITGGTSIASTIRAIGRGEGGLFLSGLSYGYQIGEYVAYINFRKLAQEVDASRTDASQRRR